MSDYRWIVTLTYRSEYGPIDIEHHIEELHEIHDLVERGPDWNALLKGTFILNPKVRTGTPSIEVAA